MVPHYIAAVPYLAKVIQRRQTECSRRTGREFDFRRTFWTPPLTPKQAYRLEEKQIQRHLQLPALVSITDHDDTRAAALLRVLERFRSAPISTEWTVPFGPAVLHLGIHNMPAQCAKSWMAELARFTAFPDSGRLTELLDMLNQREDILLVLNHPWWDEKGIGSANHRDVLLRFLHQNARHLHALELNGLRPWEENKQVIILAQRLGLPLVSGGDRHGREPNAILNLSRGASFAEFVHEVRYSRRSHVVFMPHYHEPLKMRVLQMIVDILRSYPDSLEGRRYWAERIFCRDANTQAAVSLAAMWPNGAPAVLRVAIAAMQLLEWRSVRSLLRVALHDRTTAWPAPAFEIENNTAF